MTNEIANNITYILAYNIINVTMDNIVKISAKIITNEIVNNIADILANI